ncbi:MAG: hypothetical protein JW971_10915 [Synergistales bacterium]|nr:hypothetical protein [Synergistales bacterium]
MKKDEAPGLYQELLESVDFQDVLSLRNELWKDTSPEKRASRAISLLDAMIPGGDIPQLHLIEGFVPVPEGKGAAVMLPKQVLAMEASLLAIPALVEMNEPSSLWLAQSIFQGLKNAYDLKLALETMDPQEYSELNSLFTQSRELYRLYQGKVEFPSFKTGLFDVVAVGSQDNNVIQGEVIPLDSNGRISFTNGSYGWEWYSGKIARLTSVSGNTSDSSSDGGTEAGGDCGG